MPLQVPWAAVSGEACTAVPETVGGERLVGGDPLAPTTDVEADIALLAPKAFVAVTATPRTESTSPGPRS